MRWLVLLAICLTLGCGKTPSPPTSSDPILLYEAALNAHWIEYQILKELRSADADASILEEQNKRVDKARELARKYQPK